MKENPEGMKALYAQARANLDAADAEFRRTHAGLPLDVVIADFASHGPPLQLTEQQLHDYAAAVSNGEPFEFRLT